MDLITNLLDIQVASKIAQTSKEKAAQKAKEGIKANPLDANYEQLKCDIRQLDHTDSEYKMIEKYV